MSFNKVSNPEVILESPFIFLAGVSGFCRLVTLNFFVTVTGLHQEVQTSATEELKPMLDSIANHSIKN
ncbi:hypothetical protein GPB2148_465 [marine gamma proteobacterium HTCC2148]|nr:hypothetical protein GPB2148_465 [marine gamma proteobacterium HTCC2148]